MTNKERELWREASVATKSPMPFDQAVGLIEQITLLEGKIAHLRETLKLHRDMVLRGNCTSLSSEANFRIAMTD